MPVLNTQKLSFLGGLVSPSLYYRSDLEKFGKWFSKADNIRFNTVGAFENRFGTVHVAKTKYNNISESVKLIKFVYNSNESCLLELGKNYCRAYKDNVLKCEIQTDIDTNNDGDIKYAQSADIVFIATNKGLYELIRLSKDFTSWEFRPFNWNKGITPLDEENDDDTKTISLTSTTIPTEFSLYFPNSKDGNPKQLYNPKLYINSVEKYSYTNGVISFEDFANNISSVLSDYNLTVSVNYNANVSTNKYYFLFSINGSTNATSIEIEAGYYDTISAGVSSQGSPVMLPINNGLTAGLHSTNPATTINGTVTNYAATNNSGSYDINTAISTINSNFESSYGSNVIRLRLGNTYSSYHSIITERYDNGNWTSSGVSYAYITYYPLYSVRVSATYSGTVSGAYTAQSSFNFFNEKSINEKFVIRNTVDASNIRVSYDGSNIQYSLNNGTNTTTVQTFLSDGNWRYNSSGLWNGVVNLYYSKDKGTTWTKFFTRSNDGSTNSSMTNGYSTVNDNTSGFIETDDLILLKVEASITWQNTNAKFIAELACKQFDVNSYYNIYTITDEDTATVCCIKNDVGELTNMDSWRESAFSLSKGYPTAIGFYQNRLFLGKDYMLYGSATDDFWDFYEPTTVKDSDPVTMSLLGYQVDTIQNILTMRSFFVFTTGGEFGLGSEGALTQADKYLKQLSAHGSNECNPIFCGDIVVFVDSSGNTVRAFQYSLDVDGYEATDVSVFIEQILKGKTIKTTEYLKHSKECLFLTTDGEIYVFKFYQEQNIAAWSKWKHAKYNITNLCVVPSSNNTEILYIAMDTTKGEKVIEKFDGSLYCDSLHTYTSATATDTFTTDFEKDDIVVVNDGIDSNYLVTVGDNGVIQTRNESLSITVGLRYISEATLLSPEIQQQDGVFTTFNKKRPFRVYLIYRDSYGFKVGVEDEDNQEVQYQDINAFIDEEDDLVSGKSNVLVPARFDGNSRVTFVQELPYPMHIENVLIETDYGGK